jgi:MULE transposase domain/SWIM zinc finger
MDLVTSNPGSTVVLDHTDDNRFRRLFVCYSASAAGFSTCMPVLGLDGAHLKGRYLGVLLTATAIDSNGQIFPLANAIVSAENDENWLWFCTILHNVIRQHAPAFLHPQALTFVSDRQKGLLEAVALLFTGSPHGYCLRHLYANMHKKHKNPNLRGPLYEAARANTGEQFNDAIQRMQNIDPSAVQWLSATAAKEHWVEFYFLGNRYGHITSNTAESCNAWVDEAREKPIVPMMEHMRCQLMELFSSRRRKHENIEGILVSKVATQIRNTLRERARRYHLIESTGSVFEVWSNETRRSYVVRLDNCTCTCCEWQLSDIPCGHVLCVSPHLGTDPQTYTKTFYQLDFYRQTYANAIFPSNVNAAAPVPFVLHGDPFGVNLPTPLPPNVRRKPGRPQTKRIRIAIEGGGRKKRTFTCQKCGGKGHSQRGCWKLAKPTDDQGK